MFLPDKLLAQHLHLLILIVFKTRRADLEIQLVSTGVDVGPAIYLARTFGTDIDTVVKFFIFILIFVFDPLAVMLVIAYNQALIDRGKKPQTLPDTPASTPVEEKTQAEHWKDIYSEPTGFTALIEDDERMDIIGQNGNDGLHYDENEEKNRRINSLHIELKELQDRINDTGAKNLFLNGKVTDIGANYDRTNHEQAGSIDRLKGEYDKLHSDNNDLLNRLN
jgi:hypothetical protein